MTKGELIQLLQNDNQSLDTEMDICLDCTNNDTSIQGTVTGLMYREGFNSLSLLGEYEEE